MLLLVLLLDVDKLVDGLGSVFGLFVLENVALRLDFLAENGRT